MLKHLLKNPVVNLVFSLILQALSLFFLIMYAKWRWILNFQLLFAQWGPDYDKTMAFLIQCVILGVIPFIIYTIFWIREFRKAKTEKYLDYLKMPIRILWMVISLMLIIGFICVFCFWKIGIKESDGLFIEHLIVLLPCLIIFILLDLVPFIFFKPRP